MPHQLKRLAKRGAIGIARGGTIGENGSGDIFLAFSTANEVPIESMGSVNGAFEWTGDDLCDSIYEAAVQSVEEAVVNALIAAESMDTLRPSGFPCSAINPTDLVAIVNRHQR